ncbi:MAG: hypothetical protein AAGJ93_10285 [Bacteroidota bacterium]
MKKIKQFIKEMTPVITGVLLALVINNWNENRKDKRYLEQVYAAAKEELMASSEHLAEVIPQQTALLDSIDFYSVDDQITIYDILLKVNGVRVPTVRNNAWKAIAQSKIELIEYEKIAMLSNVAEGKEIMSFKAEKLFDFIYQNLNTVSQDKKKIFKILVQDLNYSTMSMQSSIEELMKTED